MGQRLDYSTTALLVFPADDTILAVERKSDTQITLVGLKAGHTQLVFSDNGQLSNIPVVVTTTLTAGALLLTPEFNIRYPYMMLEFNSNSTYTQDNFYQNPNYTYSSTIDSPFLWHGHARMFASYFQPSTGSNTLNNATFSFINRDVDFLMGNLDAAIGRQTGAIISAVPGYGPRLRLQNVFMQDSSWMENLNFFAGVEPQVNLMDFQDNERKFGFNYTFSKNEHGSVFQDFFNAGLVSFQPPGSNAYHFNGILEGTGHVSSRVQLGGGAYLSDSSYALLFTPVYQTPSNLTQGIFSYVRQGLEQVGGAVALNDFHNYLVQMKKVFKDKITTLSATAQHQITVANPDLSITGGNNTNAQLNIFRQYTISRRYGGSYGFNRTSDPSSDIYSNVLTGYLSHPVSRRTYMQHTVSANQSNTVGGATTRQVQTNDFIQFETVNVRHQLGLTANYSESPNKLFGITLNGIANFFYKSGTMQFNGAYIKRDVSDNIQQFQFGPSIVWQPTTTNLISLTSTGSYITGQGNNTLSGSFNLIFRHYAGPGVVKDTLFRKLFKSNSHVRISGRVYLDVNFNDRFEEGDLGLENVPVSLDGKLKTNTGPGGIFSIANVTPGQHTITVSKSPIQNINRDVDYPIFIGEDSSKKEFGVPIQESKAIVTVRTILDTNDNNAHDDNDSLATVSKVELKQGELTRSVSAVDGGAIFKGIDIGKAIVSINPIDIGNNMEAISPLTQTITIGDYSEHIVTFLFKALRSLRGRVKMPEGSTLPKSMVVRLGNNSVSVDSEGYYWLKDLREGTYDLTVSNIPKGYCIAGGRPETIQVVSPFSGHFDIELTTQCNAQPQP